MNGQNERLSRNPYDEGGGRAVGDEQGELPPPGRFGEQAGAETDPRAREHLVRHPRPDATGDQRRREQGRAAEAEAEARSEGAARDDEQEEDRLDTRRARAERPHRGAERGEHAEQRERLGVESALGQLGQHHAEHEEEQRTEDHGRDAARADARSAAREERPRERDHTERRSQRERRDRSRADADRAGRCVHGVVSKRGAGDFAAITPAASSCSTVSHGRGARIFAT